MNGIFLLLSIIFIVFGILQIILFFKLWGMTNNIRAIKQKMGCEHNYWEIRKALLKGDQELAKKLVLDSLVEELIEGYHANS